MLDGLKKLNKDMALPLLFVNNDEALRKIEYIITLGGDGTILWATKMFHGDYIPPLISFSHGSLGYLCNFLIEEFEKVFTKIMDCGSSCIYLDNRLRLKAEVLGKPMR